MLMQKGVNFMFLHHCCFFLSFFLFHVKYWQEIFARKVSVLRCSFFFVKIIYVCGTNNIFVNKSMLTSLLFNSTLKIGGSVGFIRKKDNQPHELGPTCECQYWLDYENLCGVCVCT